MALYGQALANTISAATTGNQARLMFGALTAALHDAYGKLDEYDSFGIARFTGIDAGSVKAARGYLDSTNSLLGQYYPQMSVSDTALPAQQLARLRLSVSSASTAVKTVDDLFSTSFLSELTGSIYQAAKSLATGAGSGLSDLLGAFLKQTWWIFLGAGVVLIGAAAVKRQVTREFP